MSVHRHFSLLTITARAGPVGYPSDGCLGKTISFGISDDAAMRCRMTFFDVDLARRLLPALVLAAERDEPRITA